MNSPDIDPAGCSRRAVLGGLSGLATAQALPAAAAPDQSLTVATRNLYLGVDLSRLFQATSMDDVRRIAGQMLDEIRTHPYAARTDAIAAEIEAAQPDVIGVQEAARIRVQTESDFLDDPSPNASTDAVDLLDLLSTKLEARGLDYDVATSTVTTDVEVPAEDDGGPTDVRLTDRTAVLVRSDLRVVERRSGTFDAALEYPLRGHSVSIRRGYCLVDLTVGGTDVTVANTHLESADAYTRKRQAEELLETLPSDRPVVLTGDLNSGPGTTTGAYERLTESFEDSYSSLRPDADGFTCCQANDLRNEESAFSSRVDHVLHRGALEPTAIERVGADPGSKVSVESGDETVRIWPSDHAGVVATLAISPSTPTATSTLSPTETATTTDSGSSSSPNIPFYGSIAGLGGLSLAALAWYRKRR